MRAEIALEASPRPELRLLKLNGSEAGKMFSMYGTTLEACWCLYDADGPI